MKHLLEYWGICDQSSGNGLHEGLNHKAPSFHFILNCDTYYGYPPPSRNFFRNEKVLALCTISSFTSMLYNVLWFNTRNIVAQLKDMQQEQERTWIFTYVSNNSWSLSAPDLFYQIMRTLPVNGLQVQARLHTQS
jgi:hypothetical protein